MPVVLARSAPTALPRSALAKTPFTFAPQTIEFRAVEAGRPVLTMVAAAAAMAESPRRYDRADVAEHEDLVTGSWRPLVLACVTAASWSSFHHRTRPASLARR